MVLLLLERHGFAALWRPDMLAGALVAMAAYMLALQVGYRRTNGATVPRTGQMLSFAGGLLALYAAVGTPLHVLGESYLFSAHMLQHVVLTLIAPPLLLLGTPGWLLRPLLRPAPVRHVARALLNPVSGLLIFNLVYSLYHWPAFYQAGLQFPLLHLLQHSLLTGSAIIMWWPVFSPLHEHRLTEGLQMLYLFGQGIAQLLVFAFVTYSEGVLYPWYETAPRVTPYLAPRDDQALAGFIMNAGALAVFMPVLLLTYRRWIQRELARFPLYPKPSDTK